MVAAVTHKPLVRKSAEGARQEPKNLAQVLADLQILPYTPKSVKQYKRRQALKLFMWSIPARLYQGGIGLFIGSLVTFVISALVGSTHLLAGNPGWWTGLVTAVSGGISFFGFILLAVLDNSSSVQFTIYKGRWTRRRLDQWTYCNGLYPGIPEYAQQSMQDLFRSGYPVKLFEESFHVNLIGVNDPFLVAVDEDGTEFYIEVWDEPDFKKSW